MVDGMNRRCIECDGRFGRELARLSTVELSEVDNLRGGGFLSIAPAQQTAGVTGLGLWG